MWKKIIACMTLVSLCVSFSGCINSDKTSLTTITISDAPSENFSHVNITFSQVKVHKVGLNNSTSGWITIDMDPKTIDMIYLHTYNLTEVLGVQNLSVGAYSKLWIVIDGATGVLKDTGENITFDVPSGDLKYQKAFVILEGNTTINIEIDLDRSILYVPQGGVYKLTPIISEVEVEND